MKQNIQHDNQHKWWVFLGGCLMIFLVNVDATIVNLALATIAKELHTNLAQAQWVINSYLLATVIFFIIGGKLSDLFGRKSIFLLGTIFFALASLICGIAHNFTLLLIGRLIQGVGFAFTLGLALLIITQSFPENQRGFVLGLSITITGIGQALGPTLGGAILEELSWHWIFLINIPFAILSFLIIATCYKRLYFADPGLRKVDLVGALLLALSTGILLITLNDLTHDEVNVIGVIIGITISLALAVLLYFKEIKTRLPLINFRLFKIRDYSLTIILRFFFMFCIGSFLFFIPLYLQNILGYTPLMAGLMMLVYSATMAIISPMTGIWCDQAGYKPPIILSLIVCFIGYGILAMLHLHSSLSIVLLTFTLIGISFGLHITSTVQSTLSSLPKASSGEGIGVFFTCTFIGVSLGVAVSGAIMNFASQHYLEQSSSLWQHLSSSQFLALRHVANGTQAVQSVASFFSKQQFEPISTILKLAFMHGFSAIMWLNFTLIAVNLIISLLLKRKRVD